MITDHGFEVGNMFKAQLQACAGSGAAKATYRNLFDDVTGRRGGRFSVAGGVSLVGVNTVLRNERL